MVMPSEFIVYACPTGDMATQLKTYFQRSQAECGSNTAHRYMPHCTLTGFFHDVSESVSLYLSALEQALSQSRPTQPNPAIAIASLSFQAEFHYLKLESDWILSLVKTFSEQTHSDTRVDALRLKTWLHLSLAYDFPLAQHLPLQRLAAEMLDVRSPANWELRFYERHPSDTWTCHRSWKL